jgi:hypothetical protein
MIGGGGGGGIGKEIFSSIDGNFCTHSKIVVPKIYNRLNYFVVTFFYEYNPGPWLRRS